MKKVKQIYLTLFGIKCFPFIHNKKEIHTSDKDDTRAACSAILNILTSDKDDIRAACSAILNILTSDKDDTRAACSAILNSTD